MLVATGLGVNVGAGVPVDPDVGRVGVGLEVALGIALLDVGVVPELSFVVDEMSSAIEAITPITIKINRMPKVPLTVIISHVGNLDKIGVSTD